MRSIHAIKFGGLQGLTFANCNRGRMFMRLKMQYTTHVMSHSNPDKAIYLQDTNKNQPLWRPQDSVLQTNNMNLSCSRKSSLLINLLQVVLQNLFTQVLSFKIAHSDCSCLSSGRLKHNRKWCVLTGNFLIFLIHLL